MDFESRIKTIKKGSKSVRYITFQPTTWCNFSCSYCIQGQNKDKMPSESELIEKAKTFRQVLNKVDSIHPKKYEKITFLGGEISFFDMGKILNELISDKTVSVCLTSNMSAAEEKYIKLAEFLTTKSIITSFVFSFHEDHNSVDAFLEKAFSLKKYFDLHPELKAVLRTQITITENNQETCKKFFEKARVNNIDVAPGLERNIFTQKGIVHTDKTIKLFLENNKIESGKNCIVSYFDGSKDYFRREELLGRCKESILSTKDFICKDRFSTVRYFFDGRISLNCSTTTNIFDEPETLKCPYERCSICGRVCLMKGE